MKRYIHTTLKMSLASLGAIVLAQIFGLTYAITAGILAVLSVQLTRADSIELAIKRLLNAVLALAMATMVFVLFGYSVWMFMLFTILFIGASFGLTLQAGIVPSLVLASHLLVPGTFSWDVLFNSALLMIIAVSVALLLNLIYPLNTKKALESFMHKIDCLMVQAIAVLADGLKDKSLKKDLLDRFRNIQHALLTMLDEAEKVDKDILFDRKHHPMAYLKMRHAQMMRLDRMMTLLEAIETPHAYMEEIGHYMHALKADIGKEDKASPQRETLMHLLESFKQRALPKTRDEFETRAMLYQMIYELDGFLKEKITFHARYPENI